MRLDDVTEMAVVIPISIHAPRERCDAAEDVEPAPPLISIHAPRERCDGSYDKEVDFTTSFQSTHRVSDATTWYIVPILTVSPFQSTHRVSDATQH